jgi:hypothetical protein
LHPTVIDWVKYGVWTRAMFRQGSKPLNLNRLVRHVRHVPFQVGVPVQCGMCGLSRSGSLFSVACTTCPGRGPCSVWHVRHVPVQVGSLFSVACAACPGRVPVQCGMCGLSRSGSLFSVACAACPGRGPCSVWHVRPVPVQVGVIDRRSRHHRK